jgi:FkbM family methyltransferase
MSMPILREATVDIGGTPFVIASDDQYLEQLRGGFEPEMVRLFRTLINPTDVVLDVGANIGCTALLFSELARTVYAFEPSPSTYALLARNVERAERRNVVLQNLALGALAGEASLTFAPTNRSGGFVSDRTQASIGHAKEKISVRSLDDIMTATGIPRVDFIKIDVEGFEPHVLRGGQQTLERHRPAVVLELNHWCLNAFQRTSVPDFFDQLRATFPRLYAVNGAAYLNLHDEGESYSVMYHHICHSKFANLVGAFDDDRLSRFKCLYRHGLTD